VVATSLALTLTLTLAVEGVPREYQVVSDCFRSFFLDDHASLDWKCYPSISLLAT
jgi:hypothetical protein